MDALCQVAEIGPVVLEKKSFEFRQCILIISLLCYLKIDPVIWRSNNVKRLHTLIYKN